MIMTSSVGDDAYITIDVIFLAYLDGRTIEEFIWLPPLGLHGRGVWNAQEFVHVSPVVRSKGSRVI